MDCGITGMSTQTHVRTHTHTHTHACTHARTHAHIHTHTQAIANPKSEQYQDAAWRMVCPSVVLLRKFYEYALELETSLCQVLNLLCSPELPALQHLEKKQVCGVCVCVSMFTCVCLC